MPDTVRSFGRKKTILYSLLPLVLLVSTLEVAARIGELIVPPLPVDYGWGFDDASRLFVPDPVKGMMVTAPDKRVSFQYAQFPLPKPADRFRIFVIGESNVNWMDQELWLLSARLSSEYQARPLVEIINCGGLAYGSQRLLPIVSEIVDYEPDLVLIYMGHNEFEEMEQLSFMNLNTIPLQRVLYSSAFCRFLRDRLAMRTLHQVERERNQRILARPEVDYMAAAAHQFTKQERAQRMEAFHINLSAMVRICTEHGVPILLGRVATNLWQPEVPAAGTEKLEELRRLYSAGKYEEGIALARQLLKEFPRHQASDIENDITTEVAAEFGVPLADVEAAIRAAEPNGVPGETLLSDNCHLTIPGRYILLETYLPFIRDAITQWRQSAKQ